MRKNVLSFLLLFCCVFLAIAGWWILASVVFADSASDARNRLAEQPYVIYAALSLIVSAVGAAMYKWKGTEAMVKCLLILLAVIWVLCW